MNQQVIPPRQTLISHGAARLALSKCTSDDPEMINILNNYVAQCEATSRDMRNTVKAVLEMSGPPGLEEVRRRVEAGRLIVQPKG